MSDPLNPEEVLTRNHGWIERVAVSAARSHGLHDADAREFASWVTLKLIEDDYAVLRKFRGESNIRTYITTVVVRMSHAYSRERRGRWRPSRAAERLGPPASELETLVRRDGYSLEQAGEKLRTSGSTQLSDAELRQLLKQLPEREPLRPVQAPETELDEVESHFRADARVDDSEREAERGELLEALQRAMQELVEQDRAIVLMHFGQGLTLAEVARVLDIEQRPLYRSIKRLKEKLLAALIRQGVSAAAVRQLIDREDS